VLKWLFNTAFAPAIMIFAMAGVYAALPLTVAAMILPSPYFVQLGLMAVVGCICIAIGFYLPLLDKRFDPLSIRVRINPTFFHVTIWGTFGIFLLITFVTAESIPLISAFSGASARDLALQRGDFLKTRTGAESALIYISTLFVSALLPYSLALLFIRKSRSRFFLLVIFLAYSLSFLQKALFINVLFPLLYLAAHAAKRGTAKVLGIVSGSVGLLVGVTLLAFGGQESPASEAAIAASDSDYFYATYLPASATEHLIWRSTAVPMFSASDTLVVHSEQFSGQPMWGATSSFFAALFGLERINLERIVSEYQWGWSDIANTNSVYIIEAFVNFGWPGVVLFSLLVGLMLRWFNQSQDAAFKALWPIFCFAIFSSGLIGTLLSNGYAAIFLLALFAKVAAPNSQSHLQTPFPNPLRARIKS
jgi:hypothetical protein